MSSEDLQAMLDSSHQQIDNESVYIDELVDSIVQSVCKDLDDYVKYVQQLLDANDSAPITNEELDDMIMTIPTHLYFIGDKQESLGIREDIAKITETERYNQLMLDTDGAVAIKQATAKLYTQEEALMSVVYQRVTKKIKYRTDYAMELLQSCKKVLSRRMTELELSRLVPNKNNN